MDGPAGREIEIRFNCQVSYLRHEPAQSSDILRIYLEPTSICNGVAPTAAESRGRYRPANSELAELVDFEYAGDTAAGSVLTLNFSRPVRYSIDVEPLSFTLLVHVAPAAETVPPVEEDRQILHREVTRPRPETPPFVINLESMRRVPTPADASKSAPGPGEHIFYSEVVLDGKTWYRLRLGDFASAELARAALQRIKATYPGAWIDQRSADTVAVDLSVPPQEGPAGSVPTKTTADADSATAGHSEIEQLMEEARLTLVAGDRSRAIQIYTKILQLPRHPLQAKAQEYLALAREKNGQTAHAKAEYERYLALYPQGEGAARVRQRLAALIARDQRAAAAPRSGKADGRQRTSLPKASDWRVQTFFSQYYRRDVNQPSEQNEIISQSALYSDMNVDARRRGERFDFSTRLSAGYRNDFLDERFGSGNTLRVSYAYADLADARTGLRGRIGRQSRSSGGVLGRFDGVNLGYQASERLLLNAVVGKPAYSANDGVDEARTFYGASVNYGPLWDGLELGLYFVQQTIEGVDDRQAVGSEFRYFGANQSFWGMIDYDTLFNEVSSGFLQASWRIGSRLALNGSVDRRHSPFLSTGNALIGQPVETFAELMEFYSVDELRQFGDDRSPLSTTYSIGFSYSLTPKLQISADANETGMEATRESAGVFATPESSFRYIGTNIVASSLFYEGDVTIVGLRQSTSDTSDVNSITLDSRFPFGQSWRVNPRLRVDRRGRINDTDYEWVYTPGLRIQYRRSQNLRIELEGGKQYSFRQTGTADLDRETYFINFGYQVFF